MSTAGLAAVSRSAAFEEALGRVDLGFRHWLQKKNFASFYTWAYMWDEEDEIELTAAVRSSLHQLGAGSMTDTWLVAATSLVFVARGDASAVARRQGLVSDAQIYADVRSLQEATVVRENETKLEAAKVGQLAHVPLEWKGKRYRRLQNASSEKERSNIEAADRLRLGRELVEICVAAGLPFARTLDGKMLDEQAVLRCCRGLRAKTLHQYLTYWRPFGRWIASEYGLRFPQTQEHVLAYLGVLKRSGAGRTSYTSAVTALRFVEEAGEVPPAERLNALPGVSNYKKEAALSAEVAGTKPAQAGQAPAFPLQVVAALEAAVNDTALPKYHRGYAWFTLLRQWTAMRWDDTQALLPYSLERRARGVWGLLERTKTSGPGKSMGVLPVFVSEQAYLGSLGSTQAWPSG